MAWFWALLVALLLAGAAWWVFGTGRTTGERTTAAAAGEVAPTATGASTGAPVATYLAWADSARAADHAAADHGYVADGITRLAGAIADLAARDSLAGSAVAEQVQAMNRLAVQVQQDPQSRGHADLVRSAFTSGAALLGDIQGRRFPGAAAAVNDVRTAAEGINTSRPLLEQWAQMDRYFRQAAVAIRAMS